MDIYVQMSCISVFSKKFLVFNHDFIIYIGFTRISQLQTHMTSQIRSHIEYLIHTDNILVLILWKSPRPNWISLLLSWRKY